MHCENRCTKKVQPMPKAANNTGYRDKVSKETIYVVPKSKNDWGVFEGFTQG